MSGTWHHIPKFGRQVLRMDPKPRLYKKRIVLVKEGCRNRPFFTIQVKWNTQHCKESGEEQLGSWDPLPNKWGEQLVAYNVDRLNYWMANGAVPHSRVAQLLGLGGLLPVHPRSWLSAHRFRLREQEESSVPQKAEEEDDAEDEAKKNLITWGVESRYRHDLYKKDASS